MIRAFLSIAGFFGLLVILVASGMIRFLEHHRLIYFGVFVLLVWICFAQVVIEVLKWNKGIH